MTPPFSSNTTISNPEDDEEQSATVDCVRLETSIRVPQFDEAYDLFFCFFFFGGRGVAMWSVLTTVVFKIIKMAKSNCESDESNHFRLTELV